MKLLLLALFLLLAAATAEAATYWVSTTGNDSNACFNSATQPGNLATQTRRTVQQGIGCLKSNDTLYIMSGDYFGSIGTSVQSLNGPCASSEPCIPNGTGTADSNYTTISAAPGHERKVFLYGQGQRNVNLHGYVRRIALKGIVFDGERATAYNVNMACADSGDCNLAGGKGLAFVNDSNIEQVNAPIYLLFENNIFRNSLTDCILGSSFTIIRGNEIYGCGTHGIYIQRNNLVEYNTFHDALRYCVHYFDNTDSYHNTVIRFNVAYNCGEAGIGAVGGGESSTFPIFGAYIYGNVTWNTGQGIRVQYWSQAHVFNNTSLGERPGGPKADCGDGSTVAIMWGDVGDVQFRNNLSIGNTHPFCQVGASSNVQFSNNLSFPSGSGVVVDVANKNAQLVSGSPAIGAGTSVAGFSFTHPALGIPVNYSFDANGVARPQGGTWDVGACESFNGAALCPSLRAAQPSLPQPIANTPTTGPSGITTTSGTLQIGGSQFGEYFKGLIDEVRIYNRALNETEIRAIYQQDSGAAP